MAMGIFDRVFRANRTPEQVIRILESILNKTITDSQWDDFISVRIIDPELEKVRFAVEKLWVDGSPYRLTNSIDPTDLNPKGISRIKELIYSIRKRKYDPSPQFRDGV